jgi:putative oxidoreductase
MSNQQIFLLTRVFVRVALASAFLVAVADRLGLLGPYGSRNVSWGDWKHFQDYVAVLNWFVPKAWIPALSSLETVIETGLGLGLLVGLYPRIVAWSSAVLLCSFALTMSIALGILAPLGYGVFTGIGAALLLGAVAPPRTLGVAQTTPDTKSRTRLSGLTDVSEFHI